MISKEQEIASKFKRTCEVPMEECYMGGKWCATCMHFISDTCSNYIGFEHCYCRKARKVEEEVKK